MQEQSRDFLRRLMNTIGPSGYEQESARVWMNEAETFSDEVWGDLHGNAYAVVNKGGGPRVMLAGHLDEIGLLITHVDDNGYLYFTGIGGWDPQILAGQRIWISTKNGRINGAIGKKPIHLMEEKDRSNAVKIDDLWIDIGAKDKEEALKMVRIGDPAVIAYSYEEMPNNLAIARGFDDRVGAFVVLEAARLLSEMKPTAEVVAVGTVQEEIGLRGATTSAYKLNPRAGIAVDVDFATDFPTMDGEKKKSGEVKMGLGPSVTRGANINPKMYDLMIGAAEENEIPYQLKAYARGTGTDANAMQLSRSGIATGLIGVPNRYMHTPCEVVHLEDLENCYKLIAHTCAEIDEDTDFTFTDM